MSKLIEFLSIVAKCSALSEETQAELQDLLPEVEEEVAGA